MTSSLEDDKRKEYLALQLQLREVRLKINDLSHEESKLIMNLAALEKELFPDMVESKIQKILALLRRKRNETND